MNLRFREGGGVGLVSTCGFASFSSRFKLLLSYFFDVFIDTIYMKVDLKKKKKESMKI